ncbi:MAG: hypothetical protein A3F84_08400 [Candidatus Handelsmanbacteria bacterium RIFCSPLOWO2_12_FULL_64_10]|uniref:DNA helicase DnaB-like N-terminal domain-containing protein n=1 Tax=Handelsmanbacteria sp. (strain RIFCSPLOWO2_12_FULL_64_10) TaxID=1817868 RepID=A0A1F6D5C1_HANXR|nr:MAG: hypothetical protein A3F84_08400 [Candidatus Handelsmanbacteria bacterium RIFCSPLOWO2_12_FULL_64_10]
MNSVNKDLTMLPPQDLDAERAVLGAMLQGDRDAIDAPRNLLTAESFYKTAHRHIWTAICALADRGEPADVLTVRAELEKMGRLDEAGGAVAIAQLAGEVGTSANVEHHARLVEDAHVRRSLIVRASQLATRAYDPAVSVEDLISAGNVLVSERPEARNGLPALCCLTDVQPEKVEWLWFPRIPLGRLTALEGDPGEGKSFLALAVATALSVGHGLPDMEEMEPGDTVFLTAEDALSDTIRPRLDEMGADVSRVFAIDEPFPLDATGLSYLETLIRSTSARLVVFDPITAFLPPGLDIHRANEVRAVLSRLAHVAEAHRCAVLIVRHLAKGSTSKATYRGLGSIDFTAACRSVLLAGHDPDDQQSRALVQIKTNLGPTADPLGYSIEQGQFRWTGVTGLTAGQILAPEVEASSLSEAKALLREALADGARPGKEVEEEAEGAGISIRTLKRAKKVLGVKARKEGQKGPWIWELPGQSSGTPTGGVTDELDALFDTGGKP